MRANSELVRLVRGQGGPLWLNRSERHLLKFSLDRFGEPLSRFLLTGLGEEEAPRRRCFTVAFADRQDTRYKRRIRVTAEERTTDLLPCLPHGREPLVMLAFLYLLVESRRLSSFTLKYEHEELLRLLGWEGTAEVRQSLDDTAARYFCLDYEWEFSREELAAQGLRFYKGAASFVSGYGSETIEENGEKEWTESELTFAKEFVTELLGRSLFGVNWGGVISMRHNDI